MTEIPKGALDKANDLLFSDDENSPTRNVARYIADVSEKAKVGQEKLSALYKSRGGVDAEIQGLGGILNSLILPNPEDDLLKEAREICARDSESVGSPVSAAAYRSGDYDKYETMRCTLAALRKGN